MFKKTTFLLATFFAADAFAEKNCWGDTHLHTNRSFDAYTNRNFTVDPNVPTALRGYTSRTPIP